MTYGIDGVTYTRQQVWAWLKAENHHRPNEKLTPIPNRAARRRMAKGWKRIKV